MIIMKRLMPPSQRTGRLCEWRNIFMGKEVQAGNLMVTGTANALTKVEPGSLTTGQQGQPGHQPYPPSRIQESYGRGKMSNATQNGPIWQLKEAVKSKKLLVKAYSEDIERSQKLLSKSIEELAEYEDVLKRLGEQP